MNQEEQNLVPLMLKAIGEIDQSTDPNFVFFRAKRFVREATDGAEHSTQDHGVFALAQVETSPGDGVKRFRKVTMPNGFLDIRLSKDDFAHDPVVTMSSKITSICTWEDANRYSSKRGLRIADMCGEFTGQRDHGLIIPMIGLDMPRGFCSIGLDVSPQELSPTQISMIRHVMERAYARMDALLGPFAPAEIGQSLTERELDVLRRIANGMTVAQTASDLQISKRTATEYLDRAKRKTGTSKTPHTVKVALQQGMMTF